MRAAISAHGASALWISLLTAASTATTLVLACATPFPSLAALAAVHMRPRDGVALMLLAWLASQVVGFGLHDYPRDLNTLGWAIGLATAAVASAGGAYAALRWIGPAAVPVRLVAAYGAAFVAFKVVVLGWALFLGGVGSVIDPDILAHQLLRNGAILLGLYAFYHLLVAAGLPDLRRPLATR